MTRQPTKPPPCVCRTVRTAAGEQVPTAFLLAQYRLSVRTIAGDHYEGEPRTVIELPPAGAPGRWAQVLALVDDQGQIFGTPLELIDTVTPTAPPWTPANITERVHSLLVKPAQIPTESASFSMPVGYHDEAQVTVALRRLPCAPSHETTGPPSA